MIKEKRRYGICENGQIESRGEMGRRRIRAGGREDRESTSVLMQNRRAKLKNFPFPSQ